MIFLVQDGSVCEEATAEDFKQLRELFLENHPMQNEALAAIEKLLAHVTHGQMS